MNLYNCVYCPIRIFIKKPWRVAFVAALFLLGVHGSTKASAQVRVTKGTLTFTPALQSLGSVGVGSSASISVTVTNTGAASVAISGESVTGAGISVSGLTIPSTLAVGASVKVSVKFAPTTAGVVTGSLSITSNATNSVAQYPLSGTGVTAALTATPGSVAFGIVPAGTTNSQTIQLKNTGSKSLTITGTTMNAPANGYHTGGLTFPLTLGAGATTQLQLYFKPVSNGAQSGTLTVNVASPSVSKAINISGTGVAATRTISVTPSSLNFGGESLGVNHQLTVSLKNTGNSAVTVSSIGVSNSNFSTGGGISGATLAAGQTAILDVIFTPTTTAAHSGTVNISSNASNSPAAITVTGTGVSGTAHSVALSWGASSSSGIVGYYVYRSTTAGNGFARLVASPLSGLKYTDGSVQSGKTYYYQVTAVSSAGVESPRTPEATAVIP